MSTPTCPNCGSTLRKLYRRSDGHPFYGCSGFPKCRFTADAAVVEGTAAPLPTPAPVERSWSTYQQRVFDFVTEGQGNAVVIAVAGSGKTTTLEHLISIVPSDLRLAFLAFNKSIAKELGRRVAASVTRYISTLHSLGLKNIKSAFPQADINERKYFTVWNDTLAGAHLDPDTLASAEEWQDEIRKVVSLLRATLSPLTQDAVESLCDHYGISVNGSLELVAALAIQMVTALRHCTEIVDFDDMIDFPAAGIVPITEKFDWVLVDEAQDLNKAQVALVLGSVNFGGRVLAVGDPAQSIYGFRGADTQAIPNLIQALNATTLPLSITYRCPLLHVHLAQQFVPELEARPGAPEGTLEMIGISDLLRSTQPGSLVLCRTNAPLVKPCFALISQGIKATIQGRDIGSGLVTLAQRITRKSKANTLADLLYALAEHRDHEVYKLTAAKKTAQAASLSDQVDTLIALASDIRTIDDLYARIASVFSDDVEGVKFSSIHKAKGLEAERVFILRPDLLPHPMASNDWEKEQELNIMYVAFTRSKSELYFVRSEQMALDADPATLFTARLTLENEGE